MIHGRSQSPVVRPSVSARRQVLALAVLLLTAGSPGRALAGSNALTDTATVTIRVSVAPVYGLTRASHGPLLGHAKAKLCVRTNAARPRLPITGEWRDIDRPDFKIVLPSCGDLPWPIALAQVMEDRPSEGGIFLVSPE